MLKNLAFTALSALALTSIAHADQCAWIEKGDKYVVKSAKRLLNADAEFIEFCAPCGDGNPGKIQEVSSSNIQFAKMGEDVFDGTGGRESRRCAATRRITPPIAACCWASVPRLIESSAT